MPKSVLFDDPPRALINRPGCNVEHLISAAFEHGTTERTGKTKKIAGHHCVEWLIDEKTSITKAFIAEEFPISWNELFSPFMKQMFPTTQRDQMPLGMTLKSETKTKSKNKKSKFEVKKVIENPFTVDNKEYKQNTYGLEEK